MSATIKNASPLLKDRRNLVSFFRIAAVVALSITGSLEAFNVVSSSPADIGIGVAGGALAAAILKAAHLA